MKKKVLLIDDLKMIQDAIRRYLEVNDIEVISAMTLEEAEAQFVAHPDVDVIMMDGRMDSDRLNTVELTQSIRNRYDGIMIAIASDEFDRRVLIEAGCDVGVDKAASPEMVLKYLQLD